MATFLLLSQKPIIFTGLIMNDGKHHYETSPTSWKSGIGISGNVCYFLATEERLPGSRDSNLFQQ